MDLKFKNLFKMSVLSMTLNGAHPQLPKDWKWLIRFATLHSLSTITFVLLIYNVIVYDTGDIMKACSDCVLVVVYSVVTFKYFIMVYYKKNLSILIEWMDHEYECAKSLPVEDQEIVKQYAKKGQGAMWLWVVIAIGTGSLFSLKAFVLTSYYAITGEYILVPVYDIVYPFLGDKQYTVEAYWFFVVWFVLVLFYNALMYIANEPLGPIFMLHACGQLDIIRNRVEKLYVDVSTSEQLQTKIKEIVIRLDNVYSFIELINTSFSTTYEFILRGTCILLPITVYLVVEGFKHGLVSLEFFTIIAGTIVISSCPCYYSELIMNRSECLRQAVYSCRWESHWTLNGRGVRSSIIVLLTRLSRPVAINSVFLTLSLDTLANTFHDSYAIFNLMEAAW